MAFITIQTNHLVSDERQALIVDKLGKVVACVPNQSAQSILIALSKNRCGIREMRLWHWWLFGCLPMKSTSATAN